MNENLIKIKKERDYLKPMTNLKLLMTDVEIDNKNQLTFSNLNEQYTYFSTLPSLEYDNFTFQRKDSTIRFPENIDNLYHYNYCMYQNENFGNKWFYAFIEEMEYANDKVTIIKIKTDVYQTWQFDIQFLSCFVEREHVNDDTIGLHTIPENLETGEYINNSNPIQSSYANSSYICFGLSEYPSGMLAPASRQYNGIYSGLRYIIMKSQSDANALINYYDNEGKADAIQSIFLIPSTFPRMGDAGSGEWREFNNINYDFPNSFSTSAFSIEDITVPKPTNLNGYVPKNNKLFVYPYVYLNVSNNNGTSAVFNFEDFSLVSFKTYGNIGTGCSIRLVPQNYKGIIVNNEYGLVGGKLPTCSWTTDVYTNWLTQNAVNNTIGLIETGANLLPSIVTSGVEGVASMSLQFSNIGSAVSSIENLLSSRYQHSLIPNQVRGNTNCSDVNYSLGYADFTFYSMTIKQEYAKIIDDFLSIYGYKVNTVKVPNIRGRLNWNYIKTVDSIIVGDIPQNDMQEIKNMFNSGITLWHHKETFLDYSKANNII